MKDNESLRVIVVGLGMHSSVWINTIRSRNDCVIAACVAPSEKSRSRTTDEHHIKPDMLFASLDDALEKIRADFVVDITPPSVHFEIAEKTLAAGLHLLQEKPMSDSYESAGKMAQISQRCDLKYMIGQNYRFGTVPRTVRTLLDQGVIGGIEQLDIRFYINWADIPDSHYVNEPYMFINDMMVHHFDFIRYVLNANPITVNAVSWNHSWGWHKGDAAHSIVFEFPKETWCTHVACGCSVGKHTSWDGDWHLEGPEGTLTVAGGTITHVHSHRTSQKVEREITPITVADTKTAVLNEFVTAIRENRSPECSAHDNIESLKMVFAALKSIKERRWVRLEEFR